MRNFIGNILIGFAALWSFARTALFFALTIAIVMGIFISTMIGFFDLISPDVNVFGKWYWDLIAAVIGGATMWLGFQKLWEDDKLETVKK